MYGYVSFRISVPAAFPYPWNWVFWGVTIFLWLALTLRFLFWFYKSDSRVLAVIVWVGSLGLGLFTSLFFLLFARDLLYLVVLMAEKIMAFVRDVPYGNETALIPFDPERRRYLFNMINAGIVGMGGLYSLWGFINAYSSINVRNVEIKAQNLPDAFDGFEILQITDIHSGTTIKRKYVSRLVEKAKTLTPDLIALTGDLVDGTVSNLLDYIDPLSDLDAPYGKYFVTGNHEYYSGVHQWVEQIKKMGYKVLNNEHTLIEKEGEKILLAGVTDFESIALDPLNASDPLKAKEGAPETSYKILLAHQPRSIFNASEAGFDLQLSGHTHGGQFFPWNFVIRLQQPFLKGTHRYKETDLYICTGAGYWGPPLRVGSSPQISLIRLLKENKAV